MSRPILHNSTWATKVTCVVAIGVCLLASSTGCRQAGHRQALVTANPAVQLAEPSSDTVEILEDNQAISLVQHESADQEEKQNEEQAESESFPLRLPEDIAAPSAQEDPADEAVLRSGQPVEHFVDVAISCHPRVRAARARVAAASNRAPQVRSLEDPMLTNSFYPISDQALQTAAGRAGNTMSIAQKYPWPEKRWT